MQMNALLATQQIIIELLMAPMDVNAILAITLKLQQQAILNAYLAIILGN